MTQHCKQTLAPGCACVCRCAELDQLTKHSMIPETDMNQTREFGWLLWLDCVLIPVSFNRELVSITFSRYSWAHELTKKYDVGDEFGRFEMLHVEARMEWIEISLEAWAVMEGEITIVSITASQAEILPFPNTSAPRGCACQFRMCPLKSSLSLAKIFFYIWNERIKNCKRYHYEVNRSVLHVNC